MLSHLPGFEKGEIQKVITRVMTSQTVHCMILFHLMEKIVKFPGNKPLYADEAFESEFRPTPEQ